MLAEHGLSANERALLRGTIQTPLPSGKMDGWFPVAVEKGQDGALIHWRYLGQQALKEPFFADSLMAQAPHQRQVCQTPFSALDQLSVTLQPTAFIFHVSRCGSTLLCQLLSKLPSCIVVSEPPVIDSLLRFQSEQGLTVQDRVDGLRKVIFALGQKTSVSAQHFFLKFDSWHIHHMSLIRQAFPDTPCLFLYRDPQDVLASHRRQRGPQMVPYMLAPELLPVPSAAFSAGNLDIYAAHILQGFFQTALNSVSQLRLVNYSQLPGTVWDDILQAFNIRYTQDDYAAMQRRAAFHSKKSTEAFRCDPEKKQDEQKSHSDLLSELLHSYMQLESYREC
jgi:hypothetical protein